jgi:hypothetical protein
VKTALPQRNVFVKSGDESPMTCLAAHGETGSTIANGSRTYLRVIVIATMDLMGQLEKFQTKGRITFDTNGAHTG